jgi:hypothetical protein
MTTTTELRAALRNASQTLNAVARIVTTIELCRDGIWEEHKPALDSILRDFDKIKAFDGLLAPSTKEEIQERVCDPKLIDEEEGSRAARAIFDTMSEEEKFDFAFNNGSSLPSALRALQKMCYNHHNIY